LVTGRYRGERQPIDPAVEVLRNDFANRAQPADRNS
jgi:hypothetical protein